jgi:hypothetical protein
MQVTVLDVINGALKKLQVYSPDINLTADEEVDALNCLTALIESFSNDSLLVYKTTTDNFTLTGGTGTYTWGIGGTFNSERPVKIKACTVAITGTAGNVDMPVAILQYDDFAAIRLKTLQTNYPQYVYIDGSYPLNNVRFYPVPSSAVPVTFYSDKLITAFTSVTDSIVLPSGYYRWLEAQLAIELAPSYQRTASQNIVDIANSAMRLLATTNYDPLTMQTDASLMGTGGRYNIFSDGCKGSGR